ncbi:MAG: hypothetical protein FJ011_18355, partial [Chloroflexi bacterium]|nr:hypothetical protein [Chloroflexota bacterium]
MAEQTSREAKRRIRRAVILTDGPAAAAVAAETLTLSQAWLGVEPPLVVVNNSCREDAMKPLSGGDIGEDRAPTLTALSQACDCLASGEAIGRLQAAGYTLARPDEIQLWVIADVTASAGDCLAWTARPAAARPAAISALLSMLAATVWRRMRIHVSTRGLLLAEPATEVLAARWARGLVDAGAEQVYLAGAVDAARLSWQPGVWQTRAATALAALLWSNVLFHSLSQSSLSNSCDHERPAADGDVVGVWSIGAAAWQSPLGQIRRHVAIRCAMRIVEQLKEQSQAWKISESSKVWRSDDLPPWEPPELAVAPERHRLVLESVVPLAPAAQIWGRQRPAWRGLRQLPAALRASAEKRAAQAHDEQYTPRGEWLGGQVTAWEAALEQLRQERLRPATGWPAVGLYQRELEALAAELQAACVTLEDWLEEAGRGFEAAAAGATQARQALEALCAGFPAPTRAAVWATLLQPWRWLKIAWAYWIKLPRCAQKYLDAVYHQGQARWAEANTHVLRQAYLAMAQVTHDHQAAIKKLYVALAEAQADLARQLDGLDAPPEPWDEAQLQRLAGAMLPEVWPAAWTLADHAPGAYGQSGRVKKQVPELARSETGQRG